MGAGIALALLVLIGCFLLVITRRGPGRPTATSQAASSAVAELPLTPAAVEATATLEQTGATEKTSEAAEDTPAPTDQPTAAQPTTGEPSETGTPIEPTAAPPTSAPETVASPQTAPTQPPPPKPTKPKPTPRPSPTATPLPPPLFMAVQKTGEGSDPKCINVRIFLPEHFPTNTQNWKLVPEGLGRATSFNAGGYAAVCVPGDRQEFRFTIQPAGGVRILQGNRGIPAKGGENFEAYTQEAH